MLFLLQFLFAWSSFHILIITDKWIIIQFFSQLTRQLSMAVTSTLFLLYLYNVFTNTVFFLSLKTKTYVIFEKKNMENVPNVCFYPVINLQFTCWFQSIDLVMKFVHWTKLMCFFFVSDALTQCLFKNVDFCSQIDHLDNLKPNTMVACNTIVVCNTIFNNVIKWI